MRKFLSLVFITVFGWAGWKLGLFIGPMAAYFISGFFSIGGFVAWWKVDKALSE